MWYLVFTTSCALLTSGVQPCKVNQNLDWWKTSVIYQIYPRSFKDSDGDGIGDLPGITSKLEHIKDAGADALWLSPIFASPQKDFGYDISNFTDISKEYGTLEDFDKLVAGARKLGVKILLDFVPNHSSDEHVWFQKSIDRIAPYDEYYIWRDARKGSNGERLPPNNWLSRFGDSAWEWNEKRQQYYYHAFVPGQPDLNFWNPALNEEMKNVLTFWMNRGVDGFRIDSVNFLFEDDQFRDEPASGKNVPENDWEYLDHIYTLDLDKGYEIVESWQKLIDRHVTRHQTDGKLLILEAYTTLPKSMRYYEIGTNPFNFMFISDLNKDSKAGDFKRTIDRWVNAVPEGKVINWVTGNHDNHRVATRFSKKNYWRADQISMLAAMLPGIMVIYNGDEIGMIDRPFTWEETKDPAGCQAGPDAYTLMSRDPERTPYQWDNSTSAGFSDSNETWLPVHENYMTLNLAVQKEAAVSHYKVFQTLTKLKKTAVLQNGTCEVLLVTEEMLGVVRRLKGQKPIILLINFSDAPVEIDARTWLNIPEEMEVAVASVWSNILTGTLIKTSELKLRGAASVILQ